MHGLKLLYNYVSTQKQPPTYERTFLIPDSGQAEVTNSHKPELLQVAVSVPTSENPGSHWSVMTEPSVGLVLVSNAPLSGGRAGHR